MAGARHDSSLRSRLYDSSGKHQSKNPNRGLCQRRRVLQLRLSNNQAGPDVTESLGALFTGNRRSPISLIVYLGLAERHEVHSLHLKSCQFSFG